MRYDKMIAALAVAIVSVSSLCAVVLSNETYAEETIEDMGQFWSYELQFVYTGQYGTDIFWDFGDGTSSDVTNPKHVYAEKGVYIVKQVATNTIDGELKSSTAKYRVEILGNPYINFVTPSGAPKIPNLEVKYGTVPSVPTAPVWNGHEFIGYYADADYKTPASFSDKITAPMTVYVKWKGDTPLPEITPEIIKEKSNWWIGAIIGSILAIIGLVARRPIIILAGATLAIVSLVIFGGYI